MDQNKSNCSHHHHHHHDHDHDHHHDGGNNETTFPQQNVGSLRCMRHDSATSFILVVYRCCLMSLCDGCLLPQANSHHVHLLAMIMMKGMPVIMVGEKKEPPKS
jgi:hypothetical protein